MGFFDAIGSGFANYVNFSGRASRSEFWFWVLFTSIASTALAMIDAWMDAAVFGAGNDQARLFSGLFSLATFLPGLAITARRLHDTRHSGWWQLIGLTIIGLIPLFIWYCSRGTIGPNEHGGDPLGGAGQAFPASATPDAQTRREP